MPYIQQKSRAPLDQLINDLIEYLRVDGVDNDGDVNYTVSRIVAGAFEGYHGYRYNQMARAVGCLECVKLEMYRRLITPYEDLCIKKSGDIKEYGKTFI